jgi:hypothetical protein
MTPSSPQALPQLPSNVPQPPVFAQNPTGQKPKVKSSTPSWLGASDLPAPGSPGSLGGKSLIGQ